jgi:hypothetical protein
LRLFFLRRHGAFELPLKAAGAAPAGVRGGHGALDRSEAVDRLICISPLQRWQHRETTKLIDWLFAPFFIRDLDLNEAESWIDKSLDLNTFVI